MRGVMRLAVDAVIEHEGQILLLEYADETNGHYWGLPGGGVEPDESIHMAVWREVLEETGAPVVVGRLLLVNEYDPLRYGTLYSDQHELRLVFHCTLQDGVAFCEPSLPDPDQIGVGWVALAALPQVRLLPKIGPRLWAILTEQTGHDCFNTDL